MRSGPAATPLTGFALVASMQSRLSPSQGSAWLPLTRGGDPQTLYARGKIFLCSSGKGGVEHSLSSTSSLLKFSVGEDVRRVSAGAFLDVRAELHRVHPGRRHLGRRGALGVLRAPASMMRVRVPPGNRHETPMPWGASDIRSDSVNRARRTSRSGRRQEPGQ